MLALSLLRSILCHGWLRVRHKRFTPWAYTWKFMVKVCATSCKSTDWRISFSCHSLFTALPLANERIGALFECTLKSIYTSHTYTYISKDWLERETLGFLQLFSVYICCIRYGSIGRVCLATAIGSSAYSLNGCRCKIQNRFDNFHFHFHFAALADVQS